MDFFIAFFNFALALWLARRLEARWAIYVFFARPVYMTPPHLRHVADMHSLSLLGIVVDMRLARLTALTRSAAL